MKNLNLGRVLSKSEQKVVVGGCGGHCYDAFYGSNGIGSCLSSSSDFNPERDPYRPFIGIFTSGCESSKQQSFFNCWNASCVALPY